MNKHRIALLGLGMAVKPHAASLMDLHERVEVAAAYAPSPERRKQFAANYPFPVVDSLEAIIDDRSIATVLILTPPWTHDELVRRCAAAGKNVLLEKPIDVTAARAAALIDCCEHAGVAFGVVFQHRFRPASLQLHALLQRQALGQILSASATIRWWRGPDYFAQTGRGTQARDGGGVLLTQVIHTLDLLLHLAGPARSVLALADNSGLRGLDTEDRVAAAVRWANGASGVIDATNLAYPGYPERIDIAGTEGSAVLEGERLLVHLKDGRVIRHDPGDTGGSSADPMAFSHGAHRALIEEFLDAIDAGRTAMNSARSGLAVQQLIDALLESGRAPREVAL
jgi:UDP-N-acetyl-2-amino-2-deoxyglucuronate dehydrogenase